MKVFPCFPEETLIILDEFHSLLLAARLRAHAVASPSIFLSLFFFKAAQCKSQTNTDCHGLFSWNVNSRLSSANARTVGPDKNSRSSNFRVFPVGRDIRSHMSQSKL